MVIHKGSIGVLTCDNKKFNCIVCQEPFCDHVYAAKKLQLEDTPPSLITEMINASTPSVTPRKYSLNAVSSIKIPFYPTNTLQASLREPVEKTLKNEDDVLICEDGNAICDQCEGDVVDAGFKYRKLFTLFKIYDCKGMNLLSWQFLCQCALSSNLLYLIWLENHKDAK